MILFIVEIDSSPWQTDGSLSIHRYFSQHHRINQRKNLVNEDTHREISQLRSVKIQNLIHPLSVQCDYHKPYGFTSHSQCYVEETLK